MQVNHSQSVRGTEDVNSAPAGKPRLKDRLTSLASSFFSKRQPIELSFPKGKTHGHQRRVE